MNYLQRLFERAGVSDDTLENGLYAKAERLHRRYMAIRMGALESNDPGAARLLHNLAEPLYRQALAEVQQSL